MDDSITNLQKGGIVSFILGFVAVLGAQMRPVIDGWFAERRHIRELKVAEMSNTLKFLTERDEISQKTIQMLKEDRDFWKAKSEQMNVQS